MNVKMLNRVLHAPSLYIYYVRKMCQFNEVYFLHNFHGWALAMSPSHTDRHWWYESSRVYSTHVLKIDMYSSNINNWKSGQHPYLAALLFQQLNIQTQTVKISTCGTSLYTTHCLYTCTRKHGRNSFVMRKPVYIDITFYRKNWI